jgi:hypothetical protein
MEPIFNFNNNYMYRNVYGDLVPSDYFDSLSEDLENISLVCKKIKFSPNLTRFNSLITLSLSGCKMNTLPLLPNSLQTLLVMNMELNYLPSLENTSLKYICSSQNNLTILPQFPNTLKSLTCSYNKLNIISDLPNSLETIILVSNQIKKIQNFPNNAKIINISYNLLIELPKIPENTEELICHHNKLISMPKINSKKIYYLCFNCEIHGFIRCDDPIKIIEIVTKINSIYKFKSTYYHLLCRRKLRKWLWEYIREPKIRELYNPNKLNEFLTNVNEDELEDALNEWCK